MSVPASGVPFQGYRPTPEGNLNEVGEVRPNCEAWRGCPLVGLLRELQRSEKAHWFRSWFVLEAIPLLVDIGRKPKGDPPFWGVPHKTLDMALLPPETSKPSVGVIPTLSVDKSCTTSETLVSDDSPVKTNQAMVQHGFLGGDFVHPQ